MKLITEQIEEVRYIKEDTADGKKHYFIEGVFLQANKQNRNGRVYPMELLQREVARYTKNYIVQDRALGELGHPDSPQINLDRVSHKIISLKEDGNNYIGKAKIMDTPYGKIAKNLLDEGVKLGVSSRGLGSLKRTTEGHDLVQDDYMLASAADLVADPSCSDAFVRGILESKEWIMENGNWQEIDYNKTKKRLQEAHRNDFENIAIRAFTDYMSKL